MKKNKLVETLFEGGTGSFDDDICYLKRLRERFKKRLKTLKKELNISEMNYLKGKGKLSDIDTPLSCTKQISDHLLAVEIALERLELTYRSNEIDEKVKTLLKEQEIINQKMKGLEHEGQTVKKAILYH